MSGPVPNRSDDLARPRHFQRTLDCLNKAADRLLAYSEMFDIGHVHIAWLGDHIEGLRVPERRQRLTDPTHPQRADPPHPPRHDARPPPLRTRGLPHHHGRRPRQPRRGVRINGKGLTRYDDSHDAESLIAVADAAALNPAAFGHVEFFVPDTDELTVLVDVAGTKIAHAHGHQWRPGKHFEWWRGQAFNKASAMHVADLLVAGHLHHEYTDSDGTRQFIQPPALESESTWWRHAKGTAAAPGLVVALTKNGLTDLKEVIR